MVKRPRTDSLASNALLFKDAAAPQEARDDTVAHTPKYTELDSVESDDSKNNSSSQTIHRPQATMECSLPPHSLLRFRSYSAYETHYVQAHTNRCSACHANFPTAHFLTLHQAETHDPLAAARREQQQQRGAIDDANGSSSEPKTLACFVEGCPKLSRTWQTRRRHLVDKHAFPRNYDFFVVRTGVDGRRSMLRAGVDAAGHRRSSRERASASSGGGDDDDNDDDDEVHDGDADDADNHDDDDDDDEDNDTPNGAGRKDGDRMGQASPALRQSNGDSSAGSKDAGVDAITKSMSSLKFVPSSISFGMRKQRAGFAKS